MSLTAPNIQLFSLKAIQLYLQYVHVHVNQIITFVLTCAYVLKYLIALLFLKDLYFKNRKLIVFMEDG